MYKLIRILFFSGITVALMLSCNKDASTGYIHTIDEVNINMGADTFYTNVGDTLRISPVISGNSNSNSYTYSWYAFTTTTTGIADTLSYQKDLEVPIQKLPGNYIMVFEMTDQITGVFYRSTKTLVIQNDYTPGIILLGVDGGKAVMHFLNTSSGRYYSNVYKSSNGEDLGVNPISVASYAKISSMPAEVLVLCKDERGGVILNPDNFEKVRDIRNSFYVSPSPGIMNVSAYVARNNNLQDYIILDGKPCNRAVNSGDVMFKPQMVGDFWVSASTFSENQTRPVFFDTLHKRLIAHSNTSGSLVSFPFNESHTTIFDPNNLGLDLVYAGIVLGRPNQFGLFKEPDGNTYYILRMLISPTAPSCTPVEKFAMDAINIDNAQVFTSTVKFGNYLFYSVGSVCYIYNILSKTGGELLDLGAGYEINLLKFHDTELRIGFTNANHSDKKGGFVNFDITTTGGIDAAENFRMEGVCDKIIDITTKL